MRYLIQFFAMLGDLMIIGASAIMIYHEPFNAVFWFIILYSFKVWREQGGFMAWNPEFIRRFMQNARRLGF